VIDKIKEIKKKSKRPMVMSVSYWTDKIYSTNTVVIDNETDIEDLNLSLTTSLCRITTAKVLQSIQ
jgi:hypothetical protein